MLCNSASLATDSVASIGETIYDSNWFNAPLEFRRFVLLIIQQSQKPIYFTGLKLFYCNLPMFLKVIEYFFSKIY